MTTARETMLRRPHAAVTADKSTRLTVRVHVFGRSHPCSFRAGSRSQPGSPVGGRGDDMSLDLALGAAVALAPNGSMKFVDRIDHRTRADIAELGVLRTVAPQQVVFLQGEAHGRVAIIESGLLKVTAASDAGRTALLGVRGPGDAMGLAGAVSGRPRVSTVTSIGPSRLRVLTAREFDELVRRHPAVLAEVIGLLADRLHEAVEWRLFAGEAVPVRLARALLHLAASHGRTRQDGAVVIDLALTQDDLAAFIATSRDSVAKTLMAWRSKGMVETRRRGIVLLEPAALREIR